MSTKKKPTAARRAVPLKAAKPASTSSKPKSVIDRIASTTVALFEKRAAQLKAESSLLEQQSLPAEGLAGLSAGPNIPPRESAPAAPSTASGVQTAQQPPAVEDRPAATPLSPSQQLLANAIDGYEAARADTERAAAALKAAVEAERLAQVRINEAAGAHAASKNEQQQSRDLLCKALNEQAPGQLIARNGRHYLASGHLLREFDAPQSL